MKTIRSQELARSRTCAIQLPHIDGQSTIRLRPTEATSGLRQSAVGLNFAILRLVGLFLLTITSLPAVLEGQSSTCEPGMVQNGQNDIWSEECYLNDDCMEQGNPCQANDVNLVGAYIADSLGNPVLVCETGDPQNVYLWGTFQNGTGTDRYAIRSRTEIWLDGAFSQELISCSFDLLTPGTEDVALLGTFTYTCGQQVQLLNTWIGWRTYFYG